MNFSFLADMNLSPVTVYSLREYGFDIVRVSDVLPAECTDETILLYARENSKTIITQDLDFSAILALRGLSEPTLITLRLSDTNIEITTKAIINSWDEIKNYLDGYAITITDKDIRIRKLPIVV